MRTVRIPSWLRTAWVLARPFWLARGERRAWAWLMAIIGLDLVLTYAGVRQTQWQKAFFDALVARDWPGFQRQMWALAGIIAAIVGAGTARVWLEQTLEMQWRAWLTHTRLERWVLDGAFHRSAQGEEIDNADQRIAEDLRLFAGDMLKLSVGALNYAVDFFTFSAMLWGASKALLLTIGHTQWHGPSVMLATAVCYALAGSLLIERIGRGMVAVDYGQQRREADFRAALVKLRLDAEPIALMQGQRAEHAHLHHLFAGVTGNWRQVKRYTGRVTAANSAYVQFSMLLPYAMTGPGYFTGILSVGAVMQITSLFNRVRGALSWFVYRYRDFANLRAVVMRLAELDARLCTPAAGAIRCEVAGSTLQIENLHLNTPDGRRLLHIDGWRLGPGERVLLGAPSGSGKSTLAAAIAGTWTHGGGLVRRPVGGCMLLPQRAYLPEGRLLACLAYPDDPDQLPRDAARMLLDTVGLAQLAAALDHAADWQRLLSPGEQQRLHWARLLREQPALVILDEATSALDLASEVMLRAALVLTMPGAIVLDITHRPFEPPFHTSRSAWPPGTADRANRGTHAD